MSLSSSWSSGIARRMVVAAACAMLSAVSICKQPFAPLVLPTYHCFFASSQDCATSAPRATLALLTFQDCAGPVHAAAIDVGRLPLTASLISSQDRRSSKAHRTSGIWRQHSWQAGRSGVADRCMIGADSRMAAHCGRLWRESMAHLGGGKGEAGGLVRRQQYGAQIHAGQGGTPPRGLVLAASAPCAVQRAGAVWRGGVQRRAALVRRLRAGRPLTQRAQPLHGRRRRGWGRGRLADVSGRG